MKKAILCTILIIVLFMIGYYMIFKKNDNIDSTGNDTSQKIYDAEAECCQTMEAIEEIYRSIHISMITSFCPMLSDIQNALPSDKVQLIDDGLIFRDDLCNWNFVVLADKNGYAHYMFFYSDNLYSSEDFERIKVGMREEDVKAIFPGFILTKSLSTENDSESSTNYTSEFVFDNGRIGLVDWEMVNGEIAVSTTYYSEFHIEESVINRLDLN